MDEFYDIYYMLYFFIHITQRKRKHEARCYKNLFNDSKSQTWHNSTILKQQQVKTRVYGNHHKSVEKLFC